jgi:phenylalanyl-tRNA synthetase beta chain
LSARLSELAGVFRPTGEKLPEEKKILTLGAYGDIDFFELKGDIEAILEGLNIRGVKIERLTDNPSYHPGQCASVYSGGKPIGVFGQVHPLVTVNYGVDIPVFAAELDFEALFASIDPDPEYVPLPRFPAISRDMAVVCDTKIPAGSLIDAVRRAAGSLLETIGIFDVYTGDQVPKGKKSVAISLLFRHPDRTLNDTEVDELFGKALEAVKTDFGASLR